MNKLKDARFRHFSNRVLKSLNSDFAIKLFFNTFESDNSFINNVFDYSPQRRFDHFINFQIFVDQLFQGENSVFY